MTTRDERGQMTVMIVGFFVVIGMLAVVVINASAAYLQRQELNNIADGAALAAADGLREETVYRGGLDDLEDLPLDPALAARVVDDYLAGQSGLRRQVGATEGRITVRLSQRLALPLVPPGWLAETQVTAEATSLLRLSEPDAP